MREIALNTLDRLGEHGHGTGGYSIAAGYSTGRYMC
jgi:hypothetical protein